MEDSGALPLEMDVTKFKMGDVIEVFPYEGVTRAHGTGEELCNFSVKTDVLFDEVRPLLLLLHARHVLLYVRILFYVHTLLHPAQVRAGGRIPLIIGRALTARARESLELPPSDVFRSMGTWKRSSKPKAIHPAT